MDRRHDGVKNGVKRIYRCTLSTMIASMIEQRRRKLATGWNIYIYI